MRDSFETDLDWDYLSSRYNLKTGDITEMMELKSVINGKKPKRFIFLFIVIVAFIILSCTAPVAAGYGGAAGDAGLTADQRAVLWHFQGQIGKLLEKQIKNGPFFMMQIQLFTNFELNMMGRASDLNLDEAKVVVTITDFNSMKTEQIELDQTDIEVRAEQKVKEIKQEEGENFQKELNFIANDIMGLGVDIDINDESAVDKLGDENSGKIGLMIEEVKKFIRDPSSVDENKFMKENGMTREQFDALVELQKKDNAFEDQIEEIRDDTMDTLRVLSWYYNPNDWELCHEAEKAYQEAWERNTYNRGTN